jgi:hypothetical protein
MFTLQIYCLCTNIYVFYLIKVVTRIFDLHVIITGCLEALLICLHQIYETALQHYFTSLYKLGTSE